jgi:hypothetical protein
LPPLVEREGPCHYCKDTGETNQFERLSTDHSTEAEIQTVVLDRTLAEPAVDILKEIFRTHGRPELGATPGGVRTATRNLLARLDDEVPDGYAYTILRRVGVPIYCHYGLSATEIEDLVPYTERTIKQIVGSTPGVSFKKTDSRAFLKTVAENEPVTPKTLMDELGKAHSTIYQRLHNLEEFGRVTKDPTEGQGAATWETSKNWKDEFQCEQCEFETYSLNSLSTHVQMAH